jgi:hypothetical protein
MRTSNKVLLAAVAAAMALFLAFILVMGFRTRELLRQRGTTALVEAAAAACSARSPTG